MNPEKTVRRTRIKTWNSSYLVNLVWGRRVPEVHLQRFASMCRKHDVRQVLDVGCGSGLYTAYFSLKGFETVAVDVSRTGLALTKHLIRSLHFLRLAEAIGIEPSTADFIRGELPFFPVADRRAQAIFVNYTLHLLTHKELAICMSEFRRMLNDGGVLLVHEPCGDKLVPPDRTVEVLEDGSWFLKKYGVVNWNLTRDQLSKMMTDNFTVLDEERIEEDGKPKIVFLLKKD